MFTATTHRPLTRTMPYPQPGLFWLLRDLVMFAVLMGISFAIAYAVVGATYAAAYQGRAGSEIRYEPRFNTKFTAQYADSAVAGQASFLPMEQQSIADVARGR